MIRLRLTVEDLQRMRFAYSPLAEVTESLYAVHSGQLHLVHRGWHRRVAAELSRVDTPLLQAVVPAQGLIANVLFSGAVDARTSIEDQLEGVARCDPARLADDLSRAYARAELPTAAADLVAAGAGGPALLAEALGRYWERVIAPYWPQMRSVLETDVAYRGAQLARSGFDGLLSDLHPELRMGDGTLDVEAAGDSEHELGGAGMLLVPCVFAWPHLIVDPGRTGNPSITYGSRGVGTLWETDEELVDQDAVEALLGRARATVLRAVRRPRATTELALYQQTPLATSLLIASDASAGSTTTAHG
jgi:hypothetical protein